VYSNQYEYEKHRRKRAPIPDRDGAYVCPMAADSKSGKFFEFDWKVLYKHENTDFDGIKQYISEQTEAGKRTRSKRNREDKEKVNDQSHISDDRMKRMWTMTTTT
jgi:hypothetical protein